MVCPKCGMQNSNEAGFCASCGAPLVPQTPYAPPVQPGMPMQPGVPYVYKQAVPGKGLGIASMVLGIVSLVMFCSGWLAVICAIVGVILGGVGYKKAKDAGMKNGMAVAGMTCSIIALAILLLLIFAGASAISSLESML